MSAAAGRGKCPNQIHNSGSQSHNQKRTIHLLLNRTSLLALNTSCHSPPLLSRCRRSFFAKIFIDKNKTMIDTAYHDRSRGMDFI